MIETIRLSERARQQLIGIKRHTKIANWNVLCRWAFCLSLKEESAPPDEDIPTDSSVEMSWRTFAGAHEGLYWAMLLVRARRDGVEATDAAVARYFRLHLHRGISYLAAAQLRSVRDLIRLAA
ncbi:MAG TPA: DNA sulfur modification protein DndE [Terriglobales bacterium]|nr:DNA sulfur modification protein DndE [Terriglobales bacterium]